MRGNTKSKINIALRSLQEKDAPLMLEWMHDPETQGLFQKKMNETTLEDAIRFCRDSEDQDSVRQNDDLHFAIVDESDIYLGTISLKIIDYINRNAEYAIALRKGARGKGVASRATHMLLQKAFYELELKRIYLNVLSNNVAAIIFYEKMGFIYEGEFRQHIRKGEKYMNLQLYGLLKSEYEKALREK